MYINKVVFNNLIMEKDMKNLGTLATILLGLMIVVGVVFLVGSMWKENICTSGDSTNDYSNGVCSYSNGTTIDSDALTQVQNIETGIATMLSFIGILILVYIAKLLVKMTKSF